MYKEMYPTGPPGDNRLGLVEALAAPIAALVALIIAALVALVVAVVEALVGTRRHLARKTIKSTQTFCFSEFCFDSWSYRRHQP